MLDKIQQMGFEITDLELELASKNLEISENANLPFALLNSRKNIIHDFVQSALAARQPNLLSVKD